MADVLPIEFKDGTLGQRHRHLNSLVNEAFRNNAPLQTILHMKEYSVVDRFYKIDLAAKFMHVDYIIETLKSEDLVFVSRALRCSTWLVKNSLHESIINPSHLENALYPDMLATAVSKMKAWIQKHLKDEGRCEEFYKHYKMYNWTYARNFLPKCCKQFIINEIMNIAHHITPQYLKVVTEKCPEATEIYYKNVNKNKNVLSTYLDNEVQLFNKLTFLLKIKPDLFFHIVENFYHRNVFKRLNAKTTKYIMKRHKNIYLEKLEFYTVWVLNIPTVARHLTAEEVKTVVTKLARAQYVASWFNYNNVEPLLKRLDKEGLREFKRKIFVDKSFGEMTIEPPYCLPVPLAINYDKHVFSSSSDHEEDDAQDFNYRTAKRKKKYCKWGNKTLLVRLFDTYRFVNFSKSFYELRKRLHVESSHNNRMMIMNVLVSKSGDKEDQVQALLEYLTERHTNEPSTVRASVVRSLVRRAHAYRLSDTCWQLLTTFAHGLTPSECKQFTHGLVIRSALRQLSLPEDDKVTFLDHFDTFTEYRLTPAERSCVLQYVRNLLLETIRNHINNCNVVDALDILRKMLDALRASKIDIRYSTELPHIIQTLVDMDFKKTKPLLLQMYNIKTYRRIFYKEYFALKPNEDSYLNALRHNLLILKSNDIFDNLIKKEQLNHDRFLFKLSVYFKNDLAKQYLDILQQIKSTSLEDTSYSNLGRSICLLYPSNNIFTLIDSTNSIGQKKLAKQLINNVHKTRPVISLRSNNEMLPTPAFSSLLRVASKTTVKFNITSLTLLQRRGFAKLALKLSFVVFDAAELANILSKLDNHLNVYAVTQALLYFQRLGNKLDVNVWNEIKSKLLEIDYKNNKSLRQKCINNVSSVPSIIQADYCSVIYKAIKKNNIKEKSLLILKYLNHNLHKIDSEFILECLKDFIRDDFTKLMHSYKNIEMYHSYSDRSFINKYIKMTAKFLLMAVTEEERVSRFELIASPIINILVREIKYNEIKFVSDYIETFLHCLNYSNIFLNINYVNALPTFECILHIIQKHLPLERHFKTYSQIHMTMIYYKSIRQSIKQRPDIFANKEKQRNEGVDIVGFIFGKYLAHEIKELIATHFNSIREMYFEEIALYFSNHFKESKSKQQMLMSVSKSLLEANNIDATLLVAHLLTNGVVCDDENIINNILRKVDSKEVKFFLNHVQ